MIFDITPYRKDKNIGKAYNERIEVLPDDAWVIIRDGDCMYLTPEYGNIIEETIEKYGNEYALFGALTNRLGMERLCYLQKFSTNTDVKHHFEIAKTLSAKKYVVPVNLVAGFFMMFKKSTWKEVDGFKENSIYADQEFSKSILEKGKKIGQIQGLYLFHSYRIWQDTHAGAWKDVSHLK